MADGTRGRFFTIGKNVRKTYKNANERRGIAVRKIQVAKIYLFNAGLK